MGSYPKPARELILEFWREAKGPVSPSEISEKTGVMYNTVRGSLYKLRKMGLVERMSGGWVCLK
jgi:DNA-binding IclR family transcriptional regulator